MHSHLCAPCSIRWYWIAYNLSATSNAKLVRIRMLWAKQNVLRIQHKNHIIYIYIYLHTAEPRVDKIHTEQSLNAMPKAFILFHAMSISYYVWIYICMHIYLTQNICTHQRNRKATESSGFKIYTKEYQQQQQSTCV